MVGNCGNQQDPFLIEYGAPDPNIQIKVFGTANHDWGPLRAGLGSIEEASGPEVAFGHAMANAFEGKHKVMIIKGAWSGTDLNVQWRPPSAGGNTGAKYTSFVNNVNIALAEIDQPYEIAGMCWLQGESDCFTLEAANAYESNLRHFISDLRQEFNVPGMLFSIAQIMEDPVYTHHHIVRAAQAIVAETDSLTAIFDPVGLPVAGAHWILTACSAIGHSFAESLWGLIQGDMPDHLCYDSEGYITHEVWHDIEGGTVDLIPVNEYPDYIGMLTALEAPQNIADDYGLRLRGYLCAPYTGEYTFFIAGDDQNQLWLSHDEDPSGLEKIAYVDEWTPFRDWFMFESQASSPILLEGGNRYYIEVLLKEYKGNDHVSVRWVGPNLIDAIVSGVFLSPACRHQEIHIDADPVQVGDSLFVINGYASSGLPLVYELVSGDAKINGDTIHIMENSVLVRVKAFQYGDEESCYAPPVEKQFLLEISSFTAINAISGNIHVSLFPVPASDEMFLDVANAPADFRIFGWRIFDLSGRTLMHEEIEIPVRYKISMSRLPKGSYYIELNTSHGRITKLFIKS